MGTWQGSNRRLQDEADDPEYRRLLRAERRRQKRGYQLAQIPEFPVEPEWDDLKS